MAMEQVEAEIKPNTVLVVDDHAERRESLAEQIRQAAPDIRVVFANTRSDAIDHIHGDPSEFRFVIADSTLDKGPTSRHHPVEVAMTARLRSVSSAIITSHPQSYANLDLPVLARTDITRDRLQELLQQ